ncbi:hypothetical protein [Nocardia vinacea]
MSAVQDKPSGREAQRLQTPRRVFDAAVAEFARTGATCTARRIR